MLSGPVGCEGKKEKRSVGLASALTERTQSGSHRLNASLFLDHDRNKRHIHYLIISNNALTIRCSDKVINQLVYLKKTDLHL